MAKSPMRAIVYPQNVTRAGYEGGDPRFRKDSGVVMGVKHRANQGDSGGRWVTMHGTHVFIKDGETQHASAAGLPSNIGPPKGFVEGARIWYDDGRPGHDVAGTIVSADTKSMQVQFDDRARPTTIFYAAAEWMSHLSLGEVDHFITAA